VISVTDAGYLLIGGLVPSTTTFIPLFVQGVLGASATVAGFALVPMSIGWPLASTTSGRVIGQLGYRGTSLLGAVLLVLGSILLVASAGGRSVLWIGLAIFVMGLGAGYISTALLVALQGSVDWGTRGIATASAMFSRMLGSTIWVAVLGSVMNAALLSRMAELPPEVQAAAGDAGLGVTRVLLDASARATLDPAVLLQFEAVLAGGIQMVFFGVLATSLVAVVVASLLPRTIAESR
jgi:fucose permease